MKVSNILVVDDDCWIRDLIRQLLERNGYGVFSADNGREALRLLQNRAIDLVITDVVMPEQDGLEVIQAMRRERPWIPVIAISGGGVVDAAHYLEVAEQLGVRRTFAKPLPFDEFLQAVSDLLANDVSVPS